MLSAVKRQRHVLLCEILHLHYRCCGVVVILAHGYNHIIANGNIVLIGNVIITFVAFVKFHATVDIIGSAALDLLIDRRIE